MLMAIGIYLESSHLQNGSMEVFEELHNAAKKYLKKS